MFNNFSPESKDRPSSEAQTDGVCFIVRKHYAGCPCDPLPHPEMNLFLASIRVSCRDMLEGRGIDIVDVPALRSPQRRENDPPSLRELQGCPEMPDEASLYARMLWLIDPHNLAGRLRKNCEAFRHWLFRGRRDDAGVEKLGSSLLELNDGEPRRSEGDITAEYRCIKRHAEMGERRRKEVNPVARPANFILPVIQ